MTYDRKRLQRVQLDIALEIQRLCEKESIPFQLYAGSTLGAIRHSGFIPWDDDLDLVMKREAYERFLQIAETELNDKYYLQTWDNDRDFFLPFAKIRKKGTVMKESRLENFTGMDGIWVDIFPVDLWPDDPKERQKQIRRRALLITLIRAKCGYRPWTYDKSFKKWLGYLPFRALALFCNKKRLTERYLTLAKSCKDENASEYFSQADNVKRTFGFKREWFDHSIHVPFEDVSLPIQADYDGYLTRMYGDYMTPPPEEKRGGHDLAVLDFGEA